MSGLDSEVRFREALRRFDEENARDPQSVVIDGVPRPRELVYAEWLTAWVLRLRPDASEALRLAARCQHLRRWAIPRSSYEATRAGYLRWREELKKFHAHQAGEILREVGYPDEIIARVRDLNLKRDIAGDADCQTLEDALCLVTLEHQLDDLIAKTDDARMIGILQKTWRKMSPAARQQALGLSYSERARELIASAGLAA